MYVYVHLMYCRSVVCMYMYLSSSVGVSWYIYVPLLFCRSVVCMYMCTSCTVGVLCVCIYTSPVL